MNVRALTLLAVCVALLAGCTVESMETTFDDQLVEEVGTGSDAVARIGTSLTEAGEANDGFTAPEVERAMGHLLQGQLAKLSVEDVDVMAGTNRRSRERFTMLLRELRDVRSELQSARVESDARPELSDGAREFLRRWDNYVQANTARLDTLAGALRGMRPVFAQFDELLAAAVDTARLRHTRRFDRLRDDMLETMQSDVERFGSQLETVTEPNDADRALGELLNSDQEARAIAEAVNRKYPDGELARMAPE